jgi:cytochrome b6-f complex iron-sulfur subunit
MERKKFIKNFAVGGSILFVAPALLNACGKDDDPDLGNNPPEPIVVDLNDTDFASLNTVGGFAYKGDIIIIRTTETQYVALSKVCTHEGCTVEFASDANEVVCPCHQSKYTTGGTVTQGPAPANLKKYTVKVEGTKLTIT